MRRNGRSHCLFRMLVLPLFLSLGFVAHAQTPAEALPTPITYPSPSVQKFLKNILRDQKAIWTAPMQIRKEDANWMVPVGAGTMALIATDRHSADDIAKTIHLEKPSRVISAAGSTYSAAAVAATFYVVGRKTSNYRARETGVLAAQATINSVIVVSALKGITQRGRPHTGTERGQFFERGNSFPSGHSANAWAVATIIANEYGDRRAVRIAAYSAASAVSIARFTGGKHYLSDVLVGSLLGYGIGSYVYHAHHRRASRPKDEQISQPRWPMIRPQYNRAARVYGVALTWDF